MDKISSIWALFRQGEQVADPAKWKARQITGTAIAGILLALVHVLKAFGVDIPMDTGTADSLGAGLIAGVNLVLTVTTSKQAGLPAGTAMPDAQQPAAAGVQPVAEAAKSNQQDAIDKWNSPDYRG